MNEYVDKNMNFTFILKGYYLKGDKTINQAAREVKI